MILVWLTIEHSQIERIDIETGVEVVIEHVTRSVDVRASMIWELELGEIGFGAVLHGLREPDELAEPVFLEVPTGRLWGVSVSDVDDSAIAVNLSTNWDEVVVAGGRRSLDFVGKVRSCGGDDGGGNGKEHQVSYC